MNHLLKMLQEQMLREDSLVVGASNFIVPFPKKQPKDYETPLYPDKIPYALDGNEAREADKQEESRP